ARACGLLLDPRNGDILALATTPSFDPNQPGSATAEHRRCWPLTDVYEPGSTMKIVPVSLGLASGRFQRTSHIFCEHGAYRVRGAVIHDSHPYGNLSLDDVLSLSSNIGAAKVCAAFSPNEVYDQLRAFGFGNKTLVGLAGEQAGIVPLPHRWTGPTQSTLAYGQGISCTPLQLAMAYGAIAQGGILMKPRLVKSVTYPSGEIKEMRTESVRRVVSEEVAMTLTTMLTRAVESGTGTTARIAGLPIAGKTGTAQKVDFASGRYFSDRYVGSFIGVFPADNPRYVLLIIVDDPRGEYYGGVVAAPVFKRIVESMIRVRPDEFPKGILRQDGGNPDTLPASPRPQKPSQPLDTGEPIVCFASAANGSDRDTTMVRMPDVAGLSIRQAMQILSQARLSFRITGEREIVAQLPTAGTLVPAGTSCELTALEN
ncbi:MAG: penicillin-binding protein, partial [bacterium]|nr:penicillin-binding protein [bacterium]